MATMRDRRILVLVTLVAVAALAVMGVWAVVIGSPGGGGGDAQPFAPRYVEEAETAGVAHAYTGDFEFFVGGGVAAFDCNSDGLLDLYLAGGSGPASLFVNRSSAGGELSFERRAAAQTDLSSVTGAYPLDIDSDGIADLVVLRRGANQLLRGLGDCTFEPANDRWSFDGGNDWSTAFSARWEIGNEWPTIAIGNYLSSTDLNALACADNQLFAPDAAGAAFAPPVALSPGWCTLSMLFTDWDRSGRRDLRVSNDRHYYSETGDGAEQLWRMESGTAPRQYTEADGWRRLRLWGMGIASHDVTGDGYPDYFLTSQADNKLQVLAEGPALPRYEDVALRRGAIATRPYTGDTSLPSTAWHDQFEDVNSDGLIDLFIAKGNVEAMPDYATHDPNNLMLGQPDGTFREAAVEAGIVDFARARGAALVDLNLDGMLDLVVVNRIENVRLYRNLGTGTADQPGRLGTWLQVRPQQQGANRDAVGAWIEVRAGDRTQLRELTVGGGHVSGSLGPVHFGLGTTARAEVRVTWPDGEIGPWHTVSADQRVLVERGAPAPVPLP